MSAERQIAYFSMEIAVNAKVPSYSGGLGILAGDTIRSAADLNIPMVAVTLLPRNGYFFQRLDGQGNQTDEPVQWQIDDFLTDTNVTASLRLEGRDVLIRAWQCDVTSRDGFSVPVYFLDSDLSENHPDHRRLCDQLYGGDSRYRLCQEAILGIGGIRMLRALGHDRIQRYHLNEGHAALLTTELLRQQRDDTKRTSITPEDIQAVRQQCVFTTHTPVPSGHDRFDLSMVESILGSREECGITDAICHAGQLNMTYLALSLSHYVNGVAKRHSEISEHLFAEYSVDAITNGVHAATWVSRPMAAVFDRNIQDWKRDNFSLRYALGIPDNELWQAHREAKQKLIGFINRQSNAGFDADVLTIGFARRATGYKRATLILSDLERLRRISNNTGRLQLVFAGKAHPRDEVGKTLIRSIFAAAKDLAGDVPVVYLPNYEQHLAAMMTSGVDVWLNTPEPPMEASGTSGMKAALNGVPSLSVLDGWWIEGCLEGITGWAIGGRNQQIYGANSESLYDKLEATVVPKFYQDRKGFIDVMRYAIALNGSFFNTQRMLHEYMVKAYALSGATAQKFGRESLGPGLVPANWH
jgi:starch phosphorylase